MTNGVITKYYFDGTQRIAMRKNGTLTFMLSDHLGSTSFVTNATGGVLSETRYIAWDEVRYQAGTTSTGYGFNIIENQIRVSVESAIIQSEVYDGNNSISGKG